MFVLTIFDIHWVDLDAVKGWETLVTVIILATAYALGILVDRAADTVLRSVDHVLPPRAVDKPAGVARMRLTLLAKDDGVARFLDYQRSRMRIARATVLNLGLVLPAVVLFLHFRTQVSWWPTVIAAGATAAGAVVVGVLYRRIEFAYIERLSDAYRITKKAKKADLAAAICWQREGDRLEFRLVRTKGGDKWTFPKGHRKKGENLAQAAVREAEEEAGVKKGRLDGKRFAVFAYPRDSDSKRHDDDHCVAAFLFEVKKAGPPRKKEAFRTPDWFTFDEALEKLAEGGREEKYVDELAGVLRNAAQQLERAGD